MTRAFMSNGTRLLEVTHVDTDRGILGVLEWVDEDNGYLFPMRVVEASEQGFVPVAAP